VGYSLAGGFYMSSGSVAESVAGEKHTWKRVAKFETWAVHGVTPNCRISVGVPAVVVGETRGGVILRRSAVNVGELGVPPLTHGPGSGTSLATTVSRVGAP